MDIFYSAFLLFCKKQIFHYCQNGIYSGYVIIFLKYIHKCNVKKWKYNYFNFVIMIYASNNSVGEKWHIAITNVVELINIEVISWGFMNKKDNHYFMYPMVYNFSFLVRYLKWLYCLILSTVYIAFKIFILCILPFTYSTS